MLTFVEMFVKAGVLVMYEGSSYFKEREVFGVKRVDMPGNQIQNAVLGRV